MPQIKLKGTTYAGNIYDNQPVGEVIQSASDKTPAGYLELLETRRSVLRIDYPDLFRKIGIKYGAEDDQHFNLPSKYEADIVSTTQLNEAVADKVTNTQLNDALDAYYYVKDNTNFDYSNVNLNNITKSGIYSVVTDNSARDNFPSGINGVLYVYSYVIGSNQFVRQIFYRIGTINSNDYNFYSRQIRSDGTIGDWVKLMTKKDYQYNLGETVTINFNKNVFLSGCISNSTKTVYLNIELPKELPTNDDINITSMSGTLRGINGYLDNVTSNTELTSLYEITIHKSVERTAVITINKSSAFTNTTNNTVVNSLLTKLSFTIPNS